MKPIRDKHNKVIGYTKEIGDRTELIANGGRLVGFHDHKKDMTIRSGGELFGFGDQLKRMISED